ncbi:MAG TPA: efflux RND transporter periplasmic adaptor subunit [Desulfosalsimonadaceae bacterium]|nr:efflux RND transporter periplasmic adaptor subunit [Desulfosalsimonadaceae bacterium]
MKIKKWILIPLIVCLVIAAGIFLFWFFSKDEISPGMTGPDKTPTAEAANTVPAKIEMVTEWYDAVGTVQPSTQARIEAQVSGQVTDVRVNAGDMVEAGELLVTLDDRQMQARIGQAMQSLQSAKARKEQARQAVNAAQAAFAEAESAYHRIKNFYASDAATEQDLEQVQSKYLQAKAALKRARDGLSGASAGVRMAEEMVQEAKIGLSYTRIKAPAEGKVLKRLVDPGDLAMPGKPLLMLKTAGGLRLEAYVRESLIQRIQPGSKLRVALPTLQQTVESEIEELIPYADPQTRTFLVKTRLPDMAGLYPGMYGKLQIPYKQVELVLIPRQAINKVGQLELVEVKTADGWARRYIKTGNIYGEQVEVISGLSGDEILKIKEPGNDE